jgi:hypothetical protein
MIRAGREGGGQGRASPRHSGRAERRDPPPPKGVKRLKDRGSPLRFDRNDGGMGGVGAPEDNGPGSVDSTEGFSPGAGAGIRA